MSYPRLKTIIEEVRDKLKEKYRNDASAGALNEEGDAQRRLAATKLSVLDDIIKDLKTEAKEIS